MTYIVHRLGLVYAIRCFLLLRPCQFGVSPSSNTTWIVTAMFLKIVYVCFVWSSLKMCYVLVLKIVTILHIYLKIYEDFVPRSRLIMKILDHVVVHILFEFWPSMAVILLAVIENELNKECMCNVLLLYADICSN